MAVEFPWAGVMTSMQDIAKNATAWQRYLKLTPAERAIVQEALPYNAVHSLNKLLMDFGPAPAAIVVAPVPVAGPIPPRPYFTDAPTFRNWVYALDQYVGANATARWIVGQGSELPGDTMITISVPIAVSVGGNPIESSGFVLHYHPGASNAEVGNPDASKFHLKPLDYTPKYIRVTNDDIPTSFRKAAKDAARAVKF